MASFAVGFQKTGADNVQQLVETLADATRPKRLKWFEFDVANTATPADNVYSYIVHRVTGSATGTAVTPRPYDPADAATEFDAEHLITADAASFSGGEELFRIPLNARSSFRWVATPGRELVGPATASNGLSLGLGSASTTTSAGSVGLEEQ